jgi:dienelactone hydrolase
MTAQSYRAVAEEFARRGYAAVFALRGGYGTSTGRFMEILDRCNPGRAALVGRAVAEYIRGTVEAARALPYVDPRRVLIVGQSMGGLGSVALSATPPDGLMAFVNFAGGVRYGGLQCERSWVADDFGVFGRTARVPSLWIYTENDSYFPPDLAAQFHAAYTKAGGMADLLIAPAHGNDGHGFALAGIAHWRAPVDAFLKANNLPNWDAPPDDLRLLAAPAMPAALVTEAQKAAWARYLEGPAHRAFAIGGAGRTNFGYATGRSDAQTARTAASGICERIAAPCRVVAVDDALTD